MALVEHTPLLELCAREARIALADLLAREQAVGEGADKRRLLPDNPARESGRRKIGDSDFLPAGTRHTPRGIRRPDELGCGHVLAEHVATSPDRIDGAGKSSRPELLAKLADEDVDDLHLRFFPAVAIEMFEDHLFRAETADVLAQESEQSLFRSGQIDALVVHPHAVLLEADDDCGIADEKIEGRLDGRRFGPSVL